MEQRFEAYELDESNLQNDAGSVDPDKAFNNEFVDILQTSLTCCGWADPVTEFNATVSECMF